MRISLYYHELHGTACKGTEASLEQDLGALCIADSDGAVASSPARGRAVGVVCVACQAV